LARRVHLAVDLSGDPAGVRARRSIGLNHPFRSGTDHVSCGGVDIRYVLQDLRVKGAVSICISGIPDAHFLVCGTVDIAKTARVVRLRAS
jgi:hypothetical protein